MNLNGAFFSDVHSDSLDLCVNRCFDSEACVGFNFFSDGTNSICSHNIGEDSDRLNAHHGTVSGRKSCFASSIANGELDLWFNNGNEE